MLTRNFSKFCFIKYMIFYSILATMQIILWILTYNDICVIPVELLYRPTVLLIIFGAISCAEIALLDVTVPFKALIKARKKGKK